MNKPPFTKIRRVRAFEQAVKQLRAAIRDGEFRAGEKLPTEQALSEMMGVSRPTIRESLRVLESEGFIDVRRGSGAYVSDDFDSMATRAEILGWLSQREESVMQILYVREAIEGLTASLAAQNSSMELIEKLNNILAERKNLKKPIHHDAKVTKFMELDIKFHLAISEASQNPLAHEIVSNIVPAFSKANRAILWVGDKFEIAVDEHKKIIESIAAGDSKFSEELMRNHIRRVQNEICKYLEEDCKNT